MSKSNQESSPITQWEESLEVALARFMARTMVDAIHEDDMDEQDFENAKQAITSATIELALSLIGEDEPLPHDLDRAMTALDWRLRGRIEGSNDFKKQLRQSLKELSE